MARPAIQSRSSSGSLATIETSSTLEPAAASSSLFLFAQGRSVICVQHNTLALERRFERHGSDVRLIAVDNTSEAGHGRVVSIDASREAIVWDSNDGEELARFSPFEEIRVAAWMRNGNFSCGDCKGNVILFDPNQSESILARTIADPLCALAPSADCKTFALGYNNGSILVASLVPFTILHTLTTSSLSPSPITSLAWHASSSKQKSDMLATQTRDGDLRVWSVAKSIEAAGEPARVVRVLNTPEGNKRGNNWCSWSMKGRVVQYSEGETTVWDVRQKKVLWEKVETPDDLIGISVCAPKGMLFTVSKDYTVQQFGLYPPTLLNNVQHAPTVPPPSPPVSIEEKKEVAEAPEIERYQPMDDDYHLATMSPLGRIAHELELLEQMEAQGLGISNVPTPRTVSVSSRPTPSRHQSNNSTASNRSGKSISEPSDYPIISTLSKSRQNSISGGQPSPGRKPHPLAQEIHQSPIEPKPTDIPQDLFKNLRTRLPSVTYQSPRIPSSTGRLTGDDLRKEMLFCIFGWRGDVDTLIMDELDSVDSKSLTAIMLRMWLGDLEQNSLSVLLGSNLQVSADWLFLALSAMEGKKSWECVARAFVMRLLQKGDVHMAAMVLLALGDAKDAVEVYVSHKLYMEAVILASYRFKGDWKKISALVRKWGEYASANGEGSLAARCFACAGTEAPEDIPPPPAVGTHRHTRSGSQTESISTFIRGLPISSPSNPRATLRMTPKESPLKLITTFPSPATEKVPPVDRAATTSPAEMVSSLANRFFGWHSDRNNMKSPNSATSTPIAMSALSPSEPYWRGNFPGSKAGAAASSKLPVVTETPSEDTPKDEKPPEELTKSKKPVEDSKISSPLVGRNTNGFSESQTSTTLGERLASPPLRSTTPKSLNEQISRAPTPRSKSNTPVPFNEHSRSNSNTPVPFNEPSRSKSNTPVPFNEHIFRNGPSRNGTPVGTPVLQSEQFPVIATPPLGSRSPLPAPAPEAFTKEHARTGSSRKPAGLQIQWPPMDGILNGEPDLGPANVKHARKNSRATPPIARSANPPRNGTKRSDDLDESLHNIDERQEHHGMNHRSRSRVDSPDRCERPSRSRSAMEEPDRRGRSYSRRPGEREASERRGRSVLRTKITHMRSPSSPLPFTAQAALYKDEEADQFDDERYYTRPSSRTRTRPTSRDRDRDRGRSKGRMAGSIMRSPSSPALMSAQIRHYRDAEEEEEDEFDDERYYTRASSRPRGRSMGRKKNIMRSPSSPLPMSPEAQLYRDDGPDEEYYRARSKPRERLREDSRTRGPQNVPKHELRRSRSERTLTGWAKSFDRSASVDRRPSAPDMTLQRATTIRAATGLPATPKAWKAISRNQSPAPATSHRGRSPGPGPSPLINQQSFPPGPGSSPLISPPLGTGRTMSPSPRQIPMPGSARTMSPSPRMLNGRARSNSRASERPAIGLPSAPGVMKGAGSYYRNEDVADGGLSRGESIPEVPSIPESAKNAPAGHSRKLSIGRPTPLNKSFYPTPKVQMPGSPPPLPTDLPVHPALQNLPPSGALSRKVSVKSTQHARGPSLRGMHNRSVDLNGEAMVVGIDEALGHRLSPSPKPQSNANVNALIISIGMTPHSLIEEERSGRMSPAIIPPGDPRLGTPI